MTTRIPSVEKDFGSVTQFLQESGIIPEKPTPSMIHHGKAIHQSTYSLILWKFRLKKLPAHGQVFIEEIASDALQILPQILMGYSKTAKLLTRGIIENTLRHLYFLDHPIEFGRMNQDRKWYLAIEKLFEYAKIHPIYRLEQHYDAFGRLSGLYSELSAGVHGRTVEHLEMRPALNRIQYNDGSAEQESKLIAAVAESANFILAALHWSQFSKLQTIDRRIILQTMNSKTKRALQEHA